MQSYGWKPDLPDHRDLRLSLKPQKLENLPDKIDLRTKFGNIPIINQGSLGSCTACAISTAHMATQILKDGKMDIVPSKLFIYYNERVIERTTGYDSGATLRSGIKTIVRDGVCEEAAWPYVIAKFKVHPPKSCYDKAKLFQALQYERLDSTNLSELLSVLAKGFPFVFGFSVYSSFESSKVAATGIYRPDITEEKVLGGHAVTAFGYDRADETILVRNSWGTNWGIKGYFKMRFRDITNLNMADDFWLIRKVE